ncbi:MAG TPA: DegT/DnrJ/EryC1/StrS family aminotransferase [Gaiella sp.]
MSAPHWLVPLSDVVGDDELVDAASEAVRSGWWSTGPRVAELEERFAEANTTPHAIAVANGTAALHLALLAAGVGPGDEVITPSLTFVAVANAIRHTGATPVFCDILGEHDLNLDPADLEAAITPRTKAVVVLHYGGFACDMAAVAELADRHGLTVIEDAAHAVGATWEGRACGTLGALGCFSFFSNKNLPIGEGGMVVTADDELAARVRLLRSHGMTTLTWDRHRGHASAYDVVAVGFNYRLDEIRAAMALVQLGRLPAATAERARLGNRYVALLHDVEGLTVPFAERPDRAQAAHHIAVVLLPESVHREEVRAALTAAGVQTSVHYPPIHGFTAYADAAPRPLPRTEAVAPRLLTLPLYPNLTDENLELVGDRLLHAVRETRLTATHA